LSRKDKEPVQGQRNIVDFVYKLSIIGKITLKLSMKATQKFRHANLISLV